MKVSARGLMDAAGSAPIPFSARPCLPLFRHSSYARAARGIDRGIAVMKLIAFYVVFVLIGEGYRISHWSIRRTLVGDREFAGVPGLFFHCFLGRLAACGPRHLIFLVPQVSCYFGTAEPASGFPSFETTAKRPERRRMPMTDPRFTDPRLNDPVIRRDEAVGGMWGWIAGVAVVLLIGVPGHRRLEQQQQYASSGSSPPTTASTPVRPATPPSTTGSGSSSPRPSRRRRRAPRRRRRAARSNASDVFTKNQSRRHSAPGQ